MSLISIPNTFTVGSVIVASQHNSNFSVIYSDYNGNIDNTNIAAAAAITDTKIAQIITAGKVSGASLTSFPSIPAGAGLIPNANLPSAVSNIFSPIVLTVHNTSTQSIPNATHTQRTFTTVDKDSGGYWASNAYTPLVAGWYLVTYMDAILPNGAHNCFVEIYKNGSVYAIAASTPGGVFVSTGTCTTIIQMNGTTDALTFYIYQNSSLTLNAQGTSYSFVSIMRVF